MIAQGSLVDVQRDNVQLGTSGYFGHVMVRAASAAAAMCRCMRAAHRVQRTTLPAAASRCLSHPLFRCVLQLEDFLEALVPKLRKNSTALDKYRRQHVPPGVLPEQPADAPLTVNRV